MRRHRRPGQARRVADARLPAVTVLFLTGQCSAPSVTDQRSDGMSVTEPPRPFRRPSCYRRRVRAGWRPETRSCVDPGRHVGTRRHEGRHIRHRRSDSHAPGLRRRVARYLFGSSGYAHDRDDRRQRMPATDRHLTRGNATARGGRATAQQYDNQLTGMRTCVTMIRGDAAAFAGAGRRTGIRRLSRRPEPAPPYGAAVAGLGPPLPGARQGPAASSRMRQGRPHEVHARLAQGASRHDRDGATRSPRRSPTSGSRSRGSRTRGEAERLYHRLGAGGRAASRRRPPAGVPGARPTRAMQQIICGAPNARAGISVVVAKPGTYVPGIDTTIQVGRIRGDREPRHDVLRTRDGAVGRTRRHHRAARRPRSAWSSPTGWPPTARRRPTR